MAYDTSGRNRLNAPSLYLRCASSIFFDDAAAAAKESSAQHGRDDDRDCGEIVDRILRSRV